MLVKTKVGEENLEVEVALKMGGTVEEAVALVGVEVVHRLYMEAAEAEGARVIKKFMRKGFSAERISAELAEWVPGKEVKVVDKVAKASKMFAKLSDAEKELFKASLA